MSQEQSRLEEERNRELTEEQRAELEAKLKDLKLCSRWLPDSSLTTYFGKPAFHAYGNGNTRPASGGTIYGSYLKTHNINPHSGGNRPEHSQIHGRALLGGTVQVRGPGSRKAQKYPKKMVRRPIPPRVPPAKEIKDAEKHKPNDLISPQKFEDIKARELTIMPPQFKEKHLKTKTVVAQKDY